MDAEVPERVLEAESGTNHVKPYSGCPFRKFMERLSQTEPEKCGRRSYLGRLKRPSRPFTAGISHPTRRSRCALTYDLNVQVISSKKRHKAPRQPTTLRRHVREAFCFAILVRSFTARGFNFTHKGQPCTTFLCSESGMFRVGG